MATKRGPQSFMKRQRELSKQQEQKRKQGRRLDRNTRKKEEKLDASARGLPQVPEARQGPLDRYGFPTW
jgi:predicted  nucleic acid-binding Zn-ribbon protein